jgi:hypothetical protein
MKKSIKLFLGTVFALLCMGTVLAMPTLAEEITEIEVGKCSVTSPGPLCDAIIEVYGENSTAKYSLSETTTCKYAISVTVDGVQQTVYSSQKPPVQDFIPIELDEIEINKCFIFSPGALCNKLVEIFGEDSTIKYSTKKTETCNYVTSVEVNGVQTVVYLNIKPTTGDVDVSIDSNNSTKDGEIEITKCSVQSPGALCDKLVEIYGTNSTVKYSLKNTTTCKYSTSVTVDGQQITVYMSEKPQTGNVDIYIDEDGKLVIDGTGNKADENEIEDIIPLDKLMMEYLRECIIYAYDVYDEEHYSKINDYLIQKMNGIDIYYFMEDELESVKLLFEDTVIKNPDEFLANHFFKSTLNINGETFVIYSDIEIPKDTSDNNEPEVSVSDPREETDDNSMLKIIIASVGLLACVSAIVAFGVKSKTKKDNSK